MIDCTNNHITAEEFVRSLLVKFTETHAGLRITKVTIDPLNAEPIQCGNVPTIEDAFKLVLGTGSNGKVAIRVVETADTDTDFVGCSTNLPTKELLKHLLVMADDGQPALRLAIS